MKTEIEIILENQNSFTQGNCFEKLVRDILEIHRYDVFSNVNFTGMEIDLIAKHKDKRNDTIYVECKAKNKVSADEITKFLFNVNHKKADGGYFIRTKELEHQAIGFFDEIQQDDRYRNVTFFTPSKVLELLTDAKKIKTYSISEIEGNITKRILVVSHFGAYIVLLVDNSISSIPTKYYIFDADNGYFINDEDIVTKLEEKVIELTDLQVVNPSLSIVKDHGDINNIAEVQESEYWYDYLPASSKHFIGRDSVRNDVFLFFDRVTKNETKKRVFYLTAKSGWGKSSLTAEIRGRCRNKFYKNKYYTVAIDSRSALSSNFVALAFQRLIDKACKDEFLPSKFSTQNIKFTSSQDLLSSESIKALLTYLESDNKTLVLIFDQFEDVFRKEGLFKSFYKFLTDVNDVQSNIIVGFSWKTEILIPSENEAYHYWQQAKEQTVAYTLQEFGSKEVNGVVKQLESSIGKISADLKRRLIESSQGFPWLIKKLCIHIYEQILEGNDIDTLIDENLNFDILFKSDLESLNGEEIKALKFVAQRAYDGVFFEATEINEIVPENIINSLRDKRLIIRSGISYNVYWDIFRDYLVTGEMPVIGESYIFRQSVNTCLYVFTLFEKGKEYKLPELQHMLHKRIQTGALENILIELRSLGLVRKTEKSNAYSLYDNNTNPTEDFFIEYLTGKLLTYRPYLMLKNLKSDRINNYDLMRTLKTVFRGYTFHDKTWRMYANNLIKWFALSNLEIKNKIDKPEKGWAGRRGIKVAPNQKTNYIFRSSPKKISKALHSEVTINESLKNKHLRSDLYVLEILSFNNNAYQLTSFGKDLIKNKEKFNFLLANKIKSFNNINFIISHIKSNPQEEFKSKNLIDSLPTLFENSNKMSSKLVYASTLLSWAKFALENDL